jgi:hypothetical protein
VPGNGPAWFGPGVAGKGSAHGRHLASGLPVRRLREHGLITRVPRSHRYQVTDTELHTAMLLTRVHEQLLHTALAHLREPPPTPPRRLRTAAIAYQKAIDDLTTPDRTHGMTKT